ncbi:MAG: hypothetical protein WBX25_14825 [Rhodomicrobium sp.]
MEELTLGGHAPAGRTLAALISAELISEEHDSEAPILAGSAGFAALAAIALEGGISPRIGRADPTLEALILVMP